MNNLSLKYMYFCSICDKGFEILPKLNEHIYTTHVCILCQQTWESKEEFLTHVSQSHKSFTYECDECTCEVIGDYWLLSNHKINLHNKKVDYWCNRCFWEPVSVESHLEPVVPTSARSFLYSMKMRLSAPLLVLVSLEPRSTLTRATQKKKLSIHSKCQATFS